MEKNTDKTEHVSISVSQMGIYVAIFIGGAAVAAALNWGGRSLQIKSLEEKYQKLESEYNLLKQESDSVSKGKFRAEYIVHKGETIIDETVGCTLKMDDIYPLLGKIYADLYNSNKSDADDERIELYEAVPYDVFGKGKYSLTLKETTEDDCTIVFTEITSE